MDALKTFYFLFLADKKKERFDMILEPLQAITQLALISFCPVGSKLSISNNLLTIQIPSWSQGVLRTYNHDKKDDLFFLFSVISRFNKFYAYLNSREDETSDLFDSLIDLSKAGIDSIIQTYSRGEHAHLLHTLKMYRALLDKPDAFSTDSSTNSSDKKGETQDNIDDVFIRITDLYSEEHLKIIYNIFCLIQENPEDYLTYMSALNSAMTPVNVNIKKWINDHIVF
jgi:hypothetical protein